jgi:hypothetical protein
MKEKCMTFVDATNRTKHSKNSKFNHTKLAQANELVGLPNNHVGGLRTQRLTFFSASALLMPTCLQGISFGYLALIFLERGGNTSPTLFNRRVAHQAPSFGGKLTIWAESSQPPHVAIAQDDVREVAHQPPPHSVFLQRQKFR